MGRTATSARGPAGPRRIVATLLSAALLVPAAVSAASAQQPDAVDVVCAPGSTDAVPAFADVGGAHVHADAIRCAQARGWTVGRTPTSFEPLAPVTRASAARLLARLLAEVDPAPTVTPGAFPDVTAPADLVDAVGLLAGAGVVEGFEDGTFRPSQVITRAQFASVLDRTLRLAGVALPGAPSPFGDIGGSPHGAAVGSLHAAGVIAGVSATRFDPAAPLRRDQAASLLVRTGSALVAAGRLAPFGAPDEPGPVAPVRMNEIQVLGSHNSYKLPSPALPIIAMVDPVQASELDYGHVPIPEQLERQGVRQLELDVFADPEGGRYAQPLGFAFTADRYTEDELAVMESPGYKVLHAQDVDYRSSCLTLVSCLEQIKGWSDTNPDHLPLVIMIEGKDQPLEPVEFGGTTLEFVEPLPFTPELLDDLDAEIRSVFPDDRLITPDVVRGDHDTLEAAILTDGWPALDEVRGQVLFFLDSRGSQRELYREGTPSLEGRVMFTSSEPGQPDAAVLQLPEPIEQEAAIVEAVRAGYLVRTRSDTPTYEARSGETARRDAALRSGAQLVSTDYADPSPFEGSDYQVVLPGGGVARCNPVLELPGCDASRLEE